MNTELINNLQQGHPEIWNERNRDKRDALMAEFYLEDIKMHDPDFTLVGIPAVSDFIEKLLSDDHFLFTAGKPIDHTQNGARLFWNITTGKGKLESMDFFILKDDKVSEIYVFMQPVS